MCSNKYIKWINGLVWRVLGHKFLMFCSRSFYKEQCKEFVGILAVVINLVVLKESTSPFHPLNNHFHSINLQNGT